MIKIKNKEYKFKFGFKALLMYEKETGSSVSAIGDNINMITLVDIAYCGLKAAGENVTKDFVIDAIDKTLHLLTYLHKQCRKIWQRLIIWARKQKSKIAIG